MSKLRSLICFFYSANNVMCAPWWAYRNVVYCKIATFFVLLDNVLDNVIILYRAAHR
jgi:hypothetical protein